MAIQLPTIFDGEKVDLTGGAGVDHVFAKRCNMLQAVAGSGLVGVWLVSGFKGKVYLNQGDWFRGDFLKIVEADTDAVFKAAVGDLTSWEDRTE